MQIKIDTMKKEINFCCQSLLICILTLLSQLNLCLVCFVSGFHGSEEEDTPSLLCWLNRLSVFFLEKLKNLDREETAPSHILLAIMTNIV